MKSYQVIENSKPLEERELDTPEPRGKEVVVKVSHCGVCHSDLHLWHGYYELAGGQKMTLSDRGITPPFTMGHEVVGEVAAVGPDVKDAKVGDKRVVYPWIGCGECALCERGDELLCMNQRTIGVRRDGGYSSHVLVPDEKYLVDYEGVPAERACTYACSGLTAYSALKKTDTKGPEDDIVLVGAGGVGISGVLFAPHVIQGGKVIVADLDATKRSAARQFGADDTVDPGETDAAQQVHEKTGGGAAAVIDFVGSPQSTQFAMDCLRKGGKVVTVGLYGGALEVSTVLFPLAIRTIQGSYVGTLEELKEIMELAKAGKVAPIPVETRTMDKCNAALTDLEAGKVLGRVVLEA